MDTNSTIAAISTPAGMGALAVIRLSGPQATSIAEKVFRAKSGQSLMQQPHSTVRYGAIVDGQREVDEVMVSVFRAPRTFTGQDMVEIACHGSPVIQRQIVQLLIRHGAKPAAPGEFTLRAFVHGRLDLAQAEAVADLIASSSEAARRMAMQQLRGGVSSLLSQLRQKLVHLMAMLELELDFSEEDVEFANRDELRQLLLDVRTEAARLAGTFEAGNAIKEGIAVAIAGRPNAGKSTLLNRLLREERALVSDIPGTTRDSIEEQISLGGMAFRLIDTAGLRQTTDSVERMGIARAQERIARAAVVLYLVDASTPMLNMLDEVETFAKQLESGQRLLVLMSKIDCAPPTSETAVKQLMDRNICQQAILLSAQSGEGCDALEDALIAIGHSLLPEEDSVVLTNARHEHALRAAIEGIDGALNGIERGLTADLLAVELRYALEHIGSITGEITTDEVLGDIFANFCIGK